MYSSQFHRDVGGALSEIMCNAEICPEFGLVSCLRFFEEASNLDVESIGIQNGYTHRKHEEHICWFLLHGPNFHSASILGSAGRI